MRKQNRAELYKELGILTFVMLIGCTPLDQSKTAQQIIVEHNAYWGSVDENGNTGWCSQTPIPPEELVVMKDCVNATPDQMVKGADCGPSLNGANSSDN